MRTQMALLILFALSASQASAVTDPHPNGIGVYFDLNADTWQVWSGPNIPINTYVILTIPTGEEILGYEFAYRISVTPGMENMFFRLGMEFPDFVPTDINLPNYEIFGDEVAVGPFAPAHMSGSSAVVLLTWQFMFLSPAMEVEFFLGPTSGEGPTQGQLAYYSEAGIVPMHPSSGNHLLPVAMVNGEGVVPTTETSFGSLKALFR